MIRFLLPLAITMLSASTGFAETIALTGQNGGMLNGTRNCDRSGSQIICNAHATTTAPNGATGTRSRTTTASRGSITSILSGTRATGRSISRTTTITR